MRRNHGAQDGSAIVEAFHAMESRLKQYLMRFLVNYQDVEDALQETLLRSWESEKTCTIRSPKSFLFKVAKNIALSELSKKSRQLTVYIGDIQEREVIDCGTSPEQEAEMAEQLRSLSSVIAALPPQCRRVLVMRKIFGFTHMEIARRLHISHRTVEQHLTKGLKRCQESLADMPAKGRAAQDRRLG